MTPKQQYVLVAHGALVFLLGMVAGVLAAMGIVFVAAWRRARRAL